MPCAHDERGAAVADFTMVSVLVVAVFLAVFQLGLTLHTRNMLISCASEVGVLVALLVAFNRLYVGAHWPVDVVGGAAIGLLAGAVCWLGAARWPIGSGGHEARTTCR